MGGKEEGREETGVEEKGREGRGREKRTRDLMERDCPFRDFLNTPLVRVMHTRCAVKIVIFDQYIALSWKRYKVRP